MFIVIGIHAKALSRQQKTGVEIYLENLITEWQKEKKKDLKFILYTDKTLKEKIRSENFTQKILRFPFLWTQIRLSFEMLRICVHPRSYLRSFALFVPAHVMPLIHPKKTIVTIHGLEYEYFPNYYSWFSRQYLRWSTRYATRHAFKIIAVSENTKQDLIRLYHCDPEKISVIYHGVNLENSKSKLPITNKAQILHSKYFLYLGRIELKKNILGIIKAFLLFKKHAEDMPKEDAEITLKDYKLVLAGPAGYGYQNVKSQISNVKSDLRKDIIFTGYIGSKEKWQLLQGAQALIFPSFYEGFGMPILEAQSVGVPVITSRGSSMEEITTMNRESRIKNHDSKSIILGSSSALLVNPDKPEEIAEAMERIVNDEKLRRELIKRGYQNVKRFSWQRCARSTLRVLMANDNIL